MRHQIPAACVIGNKSAQLFIFDHNLFYARSQRKNLFQFFGLCLCVQFQDLLAFKIIQPFLHPFHQTQESRLGSVGDIGKNGIIEIVINRFQDGICQSLAQFFAFQVNIPVVAAGKIDPFKRTGIQRFLVNERNLLNFAIVFDDQRMSPFELLHPRNMHIESCLDGRPFGGHHKDLLILVVIGRSNP